MLAQQPTEAMDRRLDADGHAILLRRIGASSKIVVKRFSSHQQRSRAFRTWARSPTTNGCADYYRMLHLQQICSKISLSG
jgi:hypothetical protein